MLKVKRIDSLTKMQVPEHVVSFYVATCGQNGPGLGSDEKEIILLVYVILEATTGQVRYYFYYTIFNINKCNNFFTLFLGKQKKKNY